MVQQLDGVLALVLLTIGQLEIWTGFRLGGIGAVAGPNRLVEAVTVTGATLALVLRRRHPVVAAAGTGVSVVSAVALVGQLSLLAGLVPLLVVVYSASVHASREGATAVLIGGFAVQASFAVFIPEERTFGEVLFSVFVLVGAWVVGGLVRSRQHRADRIGAELLRVEAERDSWTAQALADERSAIARELHDVISHGVSVMGVSAAGARVLVDVDPAAAKVALLAIEGQARECIAELQRLLGVLRDVGAPAERRPQPTLEQVENLVEQMRRAGMPVELRVEGDPRALPAGVDLAAYRVVQEALTNVVKHGGTVPAAVLVRYEPRAIAVDICDEGPPVDGPASVGHGLLGMRERINLYGGSLWAGRRPDGGFRVTARIPLEESAT